MATAKERPRLLFIHHTTAADVLEDQRLLTDAFALEAFRFDADGRGAVGTLWGLMRAWMAQLVWLLRHLRGAHAVYGCFADYHLALPALLAPWFGVSLVVRLGGYDGNTLPAYRYGVFASGWRAPLARFVLRRATLLVTVPESLIYNENRYAAWPEALPNGVQAHVPGLTTPHRTIPTGYNASAWPEGPAVRAPSVLTVGYVGQQRDVYIKGIDVLLATAALMPDVPFRIVGVHEVGGEMLRGVADVPPNVELIPPVPRSELAALYREASVYAQLSRTEGGLPNVLAEAMLCGSIPVVSAVGGMPFTVGDLGIVVEQPDPNLVADAIRTALAEPPALREAVRVRIAETFTLSARKDALVAALDAR